MNNMILYILLYWSLSYVSGQDHYMVLWQDSSGNLVDNGHKQMKPVKWKRSVSDMLHSPLFESVENTLIKNDKSSLANLTSDPDELSSSKLKQYDKHFNEEFFLWQDDEGAPLKFGLKQLNESDNLMKSNFLRPYFQRYHSLNHNNYVGFPVSKKETASINLNENVQPFNEAVEGNNMIPRVTRKGRFTDNNDYISSIKTKPSDEAKKTFIKNIYLKNMKEYEKKTNKDTTGNTSVPGKSTRNPVDYDESLNEEVKGMSEDDTEKDTYLNEFSNNRELKSMNKRNFYGNEPFGEGSNEEKHQYSHRVHKNPNVRFRNNMVIDNLNTEDVETEFEEPPEDNMYPKRMNGPYRRRLYRDEPLEDTGDFAGEDIINTAEGNDQIRKSYFNDKMRQTEYHPYSRDEYEDHSDYRNDRQTIYDDGYYSKGSPDNNRMKVKKKSHSRLHYDSYDDNPKNVHINHHYNYIIPKVDNYNNMEFKKNMRYKTKRKKPIFKGDEDELISDIYWPHENNEFSSEQMRQNSKMCPSPTSYQYELFEEN